MSCSCHIKLLAILQCVGDWKRQNSPLCCKMSVVVGELGVVDIPVIPSAVSGGDREPEDIQWARLKVED